MIYDPQLPEPANTPNGSHPMTHAESLARVLIVDDDLSNLNVVTQILRRAGFLNVHGLSEAVQLLPSLREFQPDIILLDLHMPGANGIDLITAVNSISGPRNYLPILVLTGDSSTHARDAALAAGAKDFLTKPYERTEIVLRVRNLVETRLLHVELQRQNALLADQFAERTADLEAAKLEILERLARASDFRDESTHAHTTRVGELSAAIARKLGLPELEVDQLRVAARLHDIGKLGLSDSILQKAGPLGAAEYQEQEKHTLIGATILAGSRFPILRLGEEIALTHHEAWDGSGYPYGLTGSEIPLSGRIVSVADVFDALTHARVYKGAWTTQEAVAEITRERGRKFDPAVVDAFLEVVDTIAERSRAQRESLSVLASAQPNADMELVARYAETQRSRLVRDILGGRTLR